MLYLDFATFTKDQEYLITSQKSFDYVEGFVIINRTGLLNKWRSSFNPKDPFQSKTFKSEGRVLYCLEVAKYFNPKDKDGIDQVRHFQVHTCKIKSVSNLYCFILQPLISNAAENRSSLIRTELHSLDTIPIGGLLC